MATFKPIQPSQGLDDSGFALEEVFETGDERPVSPSVLFAEALAARPELANNSIALAKVFRRFRETVLEPVEEGHVHAVDDAVARARTLERKHVQDELETLRADADASYAHGHVDGLRTCGKTHSDLIVHDQRERQAAMIDKGVQTMQEMLVDAETQYKPEAPVVTRSCATETDLVPVEAPTLTRSFSIQTDAPVVAPEVRFVEVQQRTSRAAQFALAALCVGVGVASTFTAIYLGTVF